MSLARHPAAPRRLRRVAGLVQQAPESAFCHAPLRVRALRHQPAQPVRQLQLAARFEPYSAFGERQHDLDCAVLTQLNRPGLGGGRLGWHRPVCR
jgi:hypothetical protein